MNARILPFASLLFVVLVVLAAAPGCRTNKIKEHIDDIETVYVTSSLPGSPIVSLGASQQQNQFSAAVSNFSTAVVATELQRRVDRAAEQERIQTKFISTFFDELDHGFNFRLARSAEEACDAWIDVEIGSYGLSAATPESSVSYYLNATAYMRTCHDERLIWEKGVYFSEPITYQYLGIDATDMTKGMSHTINLTVLNGLTDKQLKTMFLNLAELAALDIVHTMVEDAFGPRSRRAGGRAADPYADEEHDEVDDRDDDRRRDDRNDRRRRRRAEDGDRRSRDDDDQRSRRRDHRDRYDEGEEEAEDEEAEQTFAPN